ncbi:MAG: MBL fold metallo-hydrolase, partial [Chryseobacterium sp.]|nr:MBL fold metallo-hydrolase [Chryseobacterium sp.]
MLSIQSFTFNPFSENTYVVYNEHRNGFIIDPGNMQDSETRTLERFISDNQLNIRNILLTHA